MKSGYILSVFLHLLFLPGALMALLLVSDQPLNTIFSDFDNLFQSISYCLVFIFISEMIYRFDFRKFKLKARYSFASFIVRIVVRSFFLCGVIFAMIFAMELDAFAPPLMIVYSLILTPRLSSFKRKVITK